MNLAATLSLDASRFTNPLAGAQQALGGMLSGLKNSLAPLGALAALTAGALGVGGAFVGLKAALDMGGELTDLSARTGEAVGKLTVFRQALDDSGVGAASAGGLINLMQRALTGVNEEGQPTVKAFEALGVSMDALNKLSPVEQITTLGAAIGKLGDPAKQTQAAMQIFGRSGGELKQFFADPSAMQTAARSLGAMPALLEKNAEMFDGVSDSIGRLKGKGLGFFVGVADQLTGSLKPLVEQLDGLDFTKSGQQVGAMAAQIGAAFQGGKLGELVGLSLQAGFAQAANFLIAAMEPASKALGGIIGSAFSAENFNDLFKGFAAIGDFLSATLMSAFAKPISFLQAGIEAALEVGSGKSEEAFQAKTKMQVNKDINAWDTDRMLKSNDPEERSKLSGLIKARNRESAELAQIVQGDSLEGRAARIRKEGGLRFFGQSSEALIGRAEETGSEAWGSIGQRIAGTGRAAAGEFSGLKVNDLFGAGGMFKQVQDLMAGFGVAGGAGPATAKAAGGPGAKDFSSGAGGGKMRESGADRLAKIGIFVGKGGPANDHARKTASNTAKIAAGIAKLVERTPTPTSTPALVWG